MPHEEHNGFWTDERDRRHTGPIPRLSRRPHDVHANGLNDNGLNANGLNANGLNDYGMNDYGLDDSAWVDRARSGFLAGARRSRDRRPNYAMRRIAALVALGVVAAPIAMLAGGSNDRQPRVAATADPPDSQLVLEPGADTPVEAATTLTIAGQVPTASWTTTADAATTATSAVVAATASSPVGVATTMPSPVTIPIGGTPSSQLRTEAGTTPPTSASTPASTASSTGSGAAAPAVTAGRSCTSEYEVVAGDYWIQIADKVSVRLADVLKANDANVDTPLYPGRTVCLPANASAPTTDPPVTNAAATTTVQATVTTATTVMSTQSSGPASTQAPVTTTAPQPRNTYTRAQVEQIIRDLWPDDLEDEAIRIATRESNLNPTVRNSCCFGLFQLYWNVHNDWMETAGVTSSAQLYDPRVNTYLAFAMYLRAGGWGPWT